MPDRTIRTLGYTAGGLAVLYLALVITTVWLATWQTQASAQVANTEAALGAIETKYYQMMDQINGSDPVSMGYVKPATVVYVASASAASSGLTRAGN